jgi:hypothetical protein
MADDIQILLLLDLASDNPLVEADVVGLLPADRRERRTLRLTDFGARPAPRGTPEDWELTGRALAAMVAAARSEADKLAGTPHFYIAGRAALPVFAATGFILSKWADVTVLNQRPTKEWDCLALRDSVAAASPFFTIVEGLDPTRPSEASGDIAVFISTSFRAARDQLRAFVSSSGHSLAGVVEASTTGRVLDASNAAQVAHEVTDILTKAKATHPHATGIALFLAGPGSLAVIAGRAVNPNIVGTALVPNFQASAYVDALALPLSDVPASVLPTDPASIAERQVVLDELAATFEELKSLVTEESLPPWMSAAARARFTHYLTELEMQRTPEGNEFYLDVVEGKVMLGSNLLEALRPVEKATRRRIGQNLLLHEVYHHDQGLRSTTYRGVGRAGFALEEVDYWADAFAIGVLAQLRIKEAGLLDGVEIGRCVSAEIRMAGAGVEAFDRAEHGARINRLAERRLRRYLLWGLQRVRALGLRQRVEVWPFFAARPVVELAPLLSDLNPSNDKVVKGSLPETELFVVLNGTLIRIKPAAQFAPAQLIEAVRSFNQDSLETAMKFARDSSADLLAFTPRDS